MRHNKRQRARGSKQGRNSRRANRPALHELFKNANDRTKQRMNRRSAKRQGLTSMNVAVAGTVDQNTPYLNWNQRLFRYLLALIMLPFCTITTIALFNVTDSITGTREAFWIGLFQTSQFFYFILGVIMMGGWIFTNLIERPLLYLYVLGHELTHAIFVYICGGKVSDIHITADGGYIMTNKSNVIIALSPYFIPFWSVVFLILSSIIRFFYEIPYHSEVLYFLIGFSWAFHLIWTVWMIPREQPDLQENGVFFSLILIYLMNVIVLSALLCMAPGNLTWYHWLNQFYNAWHIVQEFIIQSKTYL